MTIEEAFKKALSLDERAFWPVGIKQFLLPLCEYYGVRNSYYFTRHLARHIAEGKDAESFFETL